MMPKEHGCEFKRVKFRFVHRLLKHRRQFSLALGSRMSARCCSVASEIYYGGGKISEFVLKFSAV